MLRVWRSCVHSAFTFPGEGRGEERAEEFDLCILYQSRLSKQSMSLLIVRRAARCCIPSEYRLYLLAIRLEWVSCSLLLVRLLFCFLRRCLCCRKFVELVFDSFSSRVLRNKALVNCDQQRQFSLLDTFINECAEVRHCCHCIFLRSHDFRV